MISRPGEREGEGEGERGGNGGVGEGGREERRRGEGEGGRGGGYRSSKSPQEASLGPGGSQVLSSGEYQEVGSGASPGFHTPQVGIHVDMLQYKGLTGTMKIVFYTEVSFIQRLNYT